MTCILLILSLLFVDLSVFQASRVEGRLQRFVFLIGGFCCRWWWRCWWCWWGDGTQK